VTLPDERYRAIQKARELLRDLLDAKKTPRVPRKVRIAAYWALKHFPTDYDMLKAATKAPEVFEKTEDKDS
jgi:hypothetical protein